MNRLFFRPDQAGMAKTDAAAATLAAINPDVALEPFSMNITTLAGFDAFKASVCDGGGARSRVDLVLSCVDNYEARMTINQARRPPGMQLFGAVHPECVVHMLACTPLPISGRRVPAVPHRACFCAAWAQATKIR